VGKSTGITALGRAKKGRDPSTHSVYKYGRLVVYGTPKKNYQGDTNSTPL